MYEEINHNCLYLYVIDITYNPIDTLFSNVHCLLQYLDSELRKIDKHTKSYF